MKTKAEIREMKALLESNDRQAMVDYLLTHRPESGKEAAIYEDLREKELSLRQIPTEETEKTKRLLSRLQSNSIGD